MSLPEIQQASSVINKASSLLVIVPEKPSSDAFASMVALYVSLLENYEGDIDAVSPSHVPRHLQFLPGSSQVAMQPKIEPQVVLDIAGPSKIVNIRQEQLTGGVRLHVAFEKSTEILKENIETHVRALPYDAIIVLGATDLEELGDVFTDNADFFYNTPIINIDHKASNEHFGTINLVDITSSSVAEITHELIASLNNTQIEPNIATALYAGIVAATGSFQKPSTTPNAFHLAAGLLDKGADKETVITHLVKTKPLHILKLAGRIYARLRHDEYGHLFWSLLRPLDFNESNASIEDIAEVMHELDSNISDYNAAFLIYEDKPQHYTTYLLLGKGLMKRKQEIQSSLSAQKQNGALLLSTSAPSFEVAEEKILEQIRGILP